MTAPMRVAVVRPPASWSSTLVAVGVSFLNAYILMVCAPTAFHWHPGYWQSLLAIVAVRTFLMSSNPDAPGWTWPGKTGGKR